MRDVNQSNSSSHYQEPREDISNIWKALYKASEDQWRMLTDIQTFSCSKQLKDESTRLIASKLLTQLDYMDCPGAFGSLSDGYDQEPAKRAFLTAVLTHQAVRPALEKLADRNVSNIVDSLMASRGNAESIRLRELVKPKPACVLCGKQPAIQVMPDDNSNDSPRDSIHLCLHHIDELHIQTLVTRDKFKELTEIALDSL